MKSLNMLLEGGYILPRNSSYPLSQKLMVQIILFLLCTQLLLINECFHWPLHRLRGLNFSFFLYYCCISHLLLEAKRSVFSASLFFPPDPALYNQASNPITSLTGINNLQAVLTSRYGLLVAFSSVDSSFLKYSLLFVSVA